MAIVKMSRFDLIVFESQKSRLLKGLQKFREVDFINIETSSENDEDSKVFLRKASNVEELAKIDESLSNVDNAVKLLKKYHVSAKGLKAAMNGNDNYTFEKLSEKVREYDWKTVCEKLKTLGNEYSGIKTRISKKYAEINELSVWSRLDTSPDKLRKLKNLETYLGSVPIKLKSVFINQIKDLELTYCEELKIMKEDVYYLIISYKDISEKERLNEVLKNSSFSLSDLALKETPAEYIAFLRKEIEELKVSKKKVKEEIKKYDSELKNLEAVYEYLKNKKMRIEAYENLAETKNTTLISGWVPSSKAEKLEKTVEETVGNSYYVTFEEADRNDENVPIKLKNGKISSSFESLIGMYAYPKYNEIDPTPFITPFYILFFGMMGADVGYGGILLLATLFMLKFFNLNKSTRLFVKFFFYLSFSVIFWGLLYGSYFGMEIQGMWRLINPASEYNKLLVGSVLFGIVHIFFGLALKAYLLLKDNKPLDAIYDVLFWYMALSGGMLYLVFNMMNLNPGIAKISGIVSVIGMAGIVLTGGREASTIGGKLGSGLYSLYGISSYVGDFVSYSRLMALGLSGGFIASAINMIIGMVASKGAGMMVAPVIFVGGHFFNMFLSFLGAYVHTSRLMYVEFFGKFYEGGGKPFKDFRTKSKYINIED